MHIVSTSPTYVRLISQLQNSIEQLVLFRCGTGSRMLIEESSDIRPVITTQSLSKSYGKTVALSDVTLSIPRGAIGLLGPNGAGKSTLIKLLLGLQEPTSGERAMFGINVGENPIAVRQKIGYMPEADCLPLDTTAADVVAHMAEVSGLPSSDARLRASELLYICGLDEQRFRQVGGFSTGMKQRVKLAQALVHDPDLVFLDEPTNGMDPAGHDEMLSLMTRVWRDMGITVVLSSHLLEDVERVCDYVVMLDHGSIIAADDVNTLLSGTEQVRIETDRDIEILAAAVAASGYDTQIDGSMLTVSSMEDSVFDIIRDAAVDNDLAIRSMRRRRVSLEDVYIRNMKTGETTDSEAELVAR